MKTWQANWLISNLTFSQHSLVKIIFNFSLGKTLPFLKTSPNLEKIVDSFRPWGWAFNWIYFPKSKEEKFLTSYYMKIWQANWLISNLTL